MIMDVAILNASGLRVKERKDKSMSTPLLTYANAETNCVRTKASSFITHAT
jgi:hypothetical protein